MSKVHLLSYWRTRTGTVVKRCRFFVQSRIWPFLGDLRGFRGPGGTIYHPARKSVLNRRNAKNNLFCTKV